MYRAKSSVTIHTLALPTRSNSSFPDVTPVSEILAHFADAQVYSGVLSAFVVSQGSWRTELCCCDNQMDTHRVLD